MLMSNFHFYSMGIVAANKKLDSHFIEVIPVENSPYLDGELKDHFTEYKAEGKDYSEGEWKSKADVTLSVRAKWLPICNGNRRTSPDVRRGEMVMIYRFGDVDEFYWVDFLQDKHIRRLETVLYSFSNNREENKEDDADSTYYFEVSTHKKYVHLHTSKNDGEPFSYDVQINTKEGRIVITDNEDNYFVLNSKERQIKARNSDDSYVDINKKNITLNAKEKITMNAKDVVINASRSYSAYSKDYNVTSTRITYAGAMTQSGGFTNDSIITDYINSVTDVGDH